MKIYVMVLLSLLYIFDFADRYIIVSIFPYIKQEYALSDTQCGLLLSIVTWAVAVLIIPAGAIIDRWSRKKSIGIMGIFWSLFTWVAAVTTNYWQLLTSRIGIGAGEAGYVSGGNAMIAEMFPREKRGKMMGVFQAMLPLGIALGLMMGGFIASTWGWRHAFGIVAIPGLIVSILFFFVKDYKTYALVETKNADGRSAKVEKMSRKEIVKEIFRSKSLIWLAIGWTLASFATIAVTAWGASVLQRYWNISVQLSNALVSAHVMASALFFLLGGFLADWLFKKNVKSRFAIPAIALLVYAVFFLAVFLTVGSTVAIVLIIGSAVTMVWMPVIQAAIQDVAHPGLRTSTGAVIAFLQLVLGNGLAPVIFGMISDKFGLSSMFVVITISSVLSAIVFFVGMFFFKADLKRAKELDQQLGVAA